MFEIGSESSLYTWEKQIDIAGDDWLATRIEYKFPTISYELERNLLWF